MEAQAAQNFFFGKALQKVGRAVAKAGFAPIRAAFVGVQNQLQKNWLKAPLSFMQHPKKPKGKYQRRAVSANQDEFAKNSRQVCKGRGNAANLKNAILRGKETKTEK